MDSAANIDPEILYSSNSEWITLSKNLSVLRTQLEQARKDVEHLERMKEEALADPEGFLSGLKSNDLKFPRMQSIPRVPDLDLTKYSKKTSRRGNTKYEQNLDFLLAKVHEVQKRSTLVPPVLLSSSISISGNATPNSQVMISQVKEKFFEITGGPVLRPVSAPPPGGFSGSDQAFSSGRVTPNDSGIDTASGSASKMADGPSQPQPRSQRVHRSLVDNDQIQAHYNLPWSEEEKKRLDELLLVYPEEPVSARRYAKIAEALGTRTASQITNRIHKLNAKRAKQAKREAEAARDHAAKLLKTLKKSGVDLDGDDFVLEVDEETKATADYQEYMKIKNQFEDLKAQAIEHIGYSCDGCSMDPIIGLRFHCQSCLEDYDLCQACYTANAENLVAIHEITHQFEKINSSTTKTE